MAGRFIYKAFSTIDIKDPFFDTLKRDYPGTDNSTGFCEWFDKKSKSGEEALVYESENGIVAFVYLKKENEPVKLINCGLLSKKNRIKIGTLKISDDHQGQRIGEGALGLALWRWQRERVEEIYVTVFPKHESLIRLLYRFGFNKIGTNPDGEWILTKNREAISYKDSYTSFPFINPNFSRAGYMIIDDTYHDILFPYSELKNVTYDAVELSAANGISKVYVGAASRINYELGEPILIYRRFTGEGAKKYKSCVTSLCTITNIIRVKERSKALISYEELLSQIGNKSVFDQTQLKAQYDNNYNMNVFEILYYAFFGAGDNVTCAWLMENNLWSTGEYPTDRKLSPEEFKAVLERGRLDVQNTIID